MASAISGLGGKGIGKQYLPHLTDPALTGPVRPVKNDVFHLTTEIRKSQRRANTTPPSLWSFSTLRLQSCVKKQVNEPVHAGGGFPTKGFGVQVSGKSTLTPATCNLKPAPIIADLAPWVAGCPHWF
jgi:hypothetical protein